MQVHKLHSRPIPAIKVLLEWDHATQFRIMDTHSHSYGRTQELYTCKITTIKRDCIHAAPPLFLSLQAT